MSGQNIIGAVSVAPQVLVSAQLGVVDSAVYTVAVAQSVKVGQATLCNTTTSPVTVFLSIVKSGGSVDATHRVISGYSLAANDTLALASYVGGAMLGPGDMVAAYASTAAAVDLIVTGTVQS